MVSPAEQHAYRHEAPLDVTRGLMTRKAMGKRVKLGNGDVVDTGRGGMDQNGAVTYVPIIDTEVHMYLDAPGTYYDSKGRKLPDAVAKAAGYNVDRDKKLAAKVEARKAVMEDIREASADRMHEVLKSQGGYHLVEIGEGLFTVEDDDGTPFMEPNVQANAEFLFATLTGVGDAEVDQDVAPQMSFPEGTFKKDSE